jgi:hypothetical protein
MEVTQASTSRNNPKAFKCGLAFISVSRLAASFRAPSWLRDQSAPFRIGMKRLSQAGRTAPVSRQPGAAEPHRSFAFDAARDPESQTPNLKSQIPTFASSRRSRGSQHARATPSLCPASAGNGRSGRVLCGCRRFAVPASLAGTDGKHPTAGLPRVLRGIPATHRALDQCAVVPTG